MSEPREPVPVLRPPAEVELRLLVESVRDYAIFMLDPNGFVLSWNEGARRIKGYTAREIVGQHFSVFYEREEVQAGKCELELRLATEDGRFEDEGWRVRKDGTRFWANVILSVIRGPSGEVLGFAKVTRDLTQRRQVEEGRLAVVQAQAALREAEARADERARLIKTLEGDIAERVDLIMRLEVAVRARDDFLTIASHELKTPLHTLQMQVSSALHFLGPDAPERLRKRLQGAEVQVERLTRLIDGLLDLSHITAGRLGMRPQELDLVTFVRGIVEREREAIAASGSVVTIEAPVAIVGRWDRLRLDQVVTNLLSNALKYGEKKPVAVRVEEHGDRVRVVLKDHGLGIDPRDHEKIFERFERAVALDSYSGFGLGLWIVRRIVEAMGGSVHLESQRDVGSAFTVDLPRLQLEVEDA
jgi:PAS domain S-box-containing protein